MTQDLKISQIISNFSFDNKNKDSFQGPQKLVISSAHWRK